MRRQQKKNGLIKKLTLAAAVAAMTTGTFTSYAAMGFEWIEIGMEDNVRRIPISRLSDQNYRNQIIQAFNQAQLPIYLADESGAVFEISRTASAEGIFTNIEDLDPDSPYLPYAW